MLSVIMAEVRPGVWATQEKDTNQDAAGSLSSHVVTDHAPRTHQTCPGSSAWMKPATARTWDRSYRRPSRRACRTASSASGPVWPKAYAARPILMTDDY